MAIGQSAQSRLLGWDAGDPLGDDAHSSSDRGASPMGMREPGWRHHAQLGHQVAAFGVAGITSVAHPAGWKARSQFASATSELSTRSPAARDAEWQAAVVQLASRWRPQAKGVNRFVLNGRRFRGVALWGTREPHAAMPTTSTSIKNPTSIRRMSIGIRTSYLHLTCMIASLGRGVNASGASGLGRSQGNPRMIARGRIAAYNPSSTLSARTVIAPGARSAYNGQHRMVQMPKEVLHDDLARARAQRPQPPTAGSRAPRPGVDERHGDRRLVAPSLA